MPRNWPEWDMNDETRQALNQGIESELFGDQPEPSNADDVQALQNQYGRERLTEWLAGTNDRKSRAWKSARDGLSARRAGRRGIGSAWRDRFRSAARQGRADKIRQRGSLFVSITADIRTSRATDYGRTMKADLTGSALDDYLNAAQEGNHVQASMIVADAYGLDPEFIVEIDNITGIDTNLADEDNGDYEDE